jgi:NADPH2:quinone reductase
MPTHMKATILTQIGGPEGFRFSEDTPFPERKNGMVIVKNNISSVNYADVYLRTGDYPNLKSSGLILGQEAAGVIEEAPADGPFGLQK